MKSAPKGEMDRQVDRNTADTEEQTGTERQTDRWIDGSTWTDDRQRDRQMDLNGQTGW